ncbi:MAG: DUF362 domain-containing protein [Candidatus Omnitrophica bacterium]|nr:DUF362 domain-containing protein [Candidatus Omnitrophota bacterium]
MKSTVFFIPTGDKEPEQSVVKKINRLIVESKLFDSFLQGAECVIKLHFGEQGNTGFVRPRYVGTIVRYLKRMGLSVFLSDTNTLYRGKRTNCKDHLLLAQQHGFTERNTSAPVIIPDDNDPNQVVEVSYAGKYVTVAKICRIFLDTDYLVSVAHFKGHIMTGFGGAIKNIGMGCATRAGKLFQHVEVSPIIKLNNCRGCQACVLVCPKGAITLNQQKATVDQRLCIGCASCIAACRYRAIDVPWESGADIIQEKMVEYANAVLSRKKDKAVFINFCLKITAECDCIAKDDPALLPDVGILASSDPVAVDKASMDCCIELAGYDIFKKAHPKRDGLKQLIYAEKIGLGTTTYELVRL